MVNKVVNCRLRRHKLGVKVWIKVIPEIEHFFRHWGGEVEEGPTAGRMWKALDDKPLKLWAYEGRHEAYGLNRGGSALIDLHGEGNINISFLRLIDAAQGRSFVVDSVMSTEEMEKVASQIVKAGEQFYLSYIRPVDINCYVGIVDYSKAPSEVVNG